MKQKPPVLRTTLSILFCAAVAAAQVLAIWQAMRSPKAFHPAILMVELPFPLIAGHLFYRGKSDGGWIIMGAYIPCMVFFWLLGGPYLLAEPAIFTALMLINLGALGTYSAYAVLNVLRRYFAPERS